MKQQRIPRFKFTKKARNPFTYKRYPHTDVSAFMRSRSNYSPPPLIKQPKTI